MKEISIKLEDNEMKKLNSWFSFHEFLSIVEPMVFYATLLLTMIVFMKSDIVDKFMPLGISLCILNIILLKMQNFIADKLDKVDAIMNSCIEEQISKDEATKQLEELLKNE